MATGPHIELVSIHDNRRDVAAVARTISAAFAHDPLVQWLRPGTARWGRDGPEQAWQQRRVRRALVDGLVLTSPRVSNIRRPLPHHEEQREKNVMSQVNEITNDTAEAEDAGAVVMIFPPAHRRRHIIRRSLQACKMWLLETFSPIPEEGSNEQRVEQMLETHESAIERVKHQGGVRDAWYLEVFAVHPTLQGQRIGGAAMRRLMELVGTDPMVLECTSGSNVAFYQKFGFEVIEEVVLSDRSVEGGDSCRLWVMLKRGRR